MQPIERLAADNVTSIYTQEVESIPYQATISSMSHDFH